MGDKNGGKKRESVNSMLPVWLDDDDDDEEEICVYVSVCARVCDTYTQQKWLNYNLYDSRQNKTKPIRI